MSKGQKETATQKRNRIATEKSIRLKRTAQQKIEIATRIGTGETLRDICRSPGMVHWNTVYNWIDNDKEFAVRIAHARETGYDAIAQDCLFIADDSSNDYTKVEKESGDRANTEHIQRSKLRIETRLKLLAKWSPKRYGDNSQIRLTDNDGNPLSKAIAAAAGNLSLNPPDSGE